MKWHTFLGIVISCSVSAFFGFLSFMAYSVNELNTKLSVIIERVTVHDRQFDSTDKKFENYDRRFERMESRLSHEK